MSRHGLSLVYVGALPPHPGGGAISCFQILAGPPGSGIASPAATDDPGVAPDARP